MHLSEQDKVPQANETLAKYVQRLRRSLGLSQREVALKADIHPQSLGKLERGKTNCLNRSTQRGLAYALQIPEDYLEAVCRGEVLPALQTLKFCPKCWKAGMLPESAWLHRRAHYCFECGTKLRDRCVSCDAAITSLKHRFCPFCGTSYIALNSTESRN